MRTLALGWSNSRRRGKRLDFFVSGAPLLKEIEARGFDLVPRLGGGYLPIDGKTRDLLLLEEESDAPSGRVALYVCAECEDLACGCVSARISRDGPDFVWSDFVFESAADQEPSPLEKLGPFRFSGESYRRALTVSISPPDL